MLFVRYTPVDDRIDYGNPESFLPLIDLGNGYKDMGTIEGMSTSLIDYGKGYLIGIGIIGLIDWNSATLQI